MHVRAADLCSVHVRSPSILVLQWKVFLYVQMYASYPQHVPDV